MPNDVDLSHMSAQQTKEALGELVRMGLQIHGAVVLILRPDGQLTSVDPAVLGKIPVEELVPYLLSWSDEEIEAYLARR